MNIADQIQKVRSNISQCCAECDRKPETIRLLAVSKTHPAETIQQAYAAGVTEFGENYLQEAVDKIEICRNLPVQWHFIGPLQSNKTRPIAENFDWVQSVDREKILVRLNAQRPAGLQPLQVCIQANLFYEAQKKGANREQLDKLLEIASHLPHINLRGLMVIPPIQQDYQAQLDQFKQVAEVYNQLKQKYPSMDTLSMGMSGDMQAAIASGSDMVRVGTGIFGARGHNHQQANQPK